MHKLLRVRVRNLSHRSIISSPNQPLFHPSHSHLIPHMYLLHHHSHQILMHHPQPPSQRIYMFLQEVTNPRNPWATSLRNHVVQDWLLLLHKTLDKLPDDCLLLRRLILLIKVHLFGLHHRPHICPIGMIYRRPLGNHQRPDVGLQGLATNPFPLPSPGNLHRLHKRVLL